MRRFPAKFFLGLGNNGKWKINWITMFLKREKVLKIVNCLNTFLARNSKFLTNQTADVETKDVTIPIRYRGIRV
jgi:hypothetical protein